MSKDFRGANSFRSQERKVPIGNFQRVSRLGFVTAPMSLYAGKSNCTMFGRVLGW